MADAVYDSVVRLTTREFAFKKALAEQTRFSSVQNILDFGCGTGTLTMMLKQAAPDAEVIGIDGDPEILDLARKKARSAGSVILFVEGKSFGLPFDDESID